MRRKKTNLRIIVAQLLFDEVIDHENPILGELRYELAMLQEAGLTIENADIIQPCGDIDPMRKVSLAADSFLEGS